MSKRKTKANRKVLLAVPIVWSLLTALQAAATAADGGPTDAGADARADGGGAPLDNNGNICSVAGQGHGFGTALGAGCC